MHGYQLLCEIEPSIEAAFDSHMTTRRGQREPIYPPTVLARAAAISGQIGDPSRDPLVYGPVLRAGLQDHLDTFGETYGVDLQPVLAATFLVNLLTEDNLPYYTHKSMGVAGQSEALTAWVREWTAEEDSHGVLMRDYALLAGLIADAGTIEHATYQAGRTSQLRGGTEIDPDSIRHTFAYLTLQEHLTKEAHKNLSWLLDRLGRTVLRPIGGDEHNHYEFYLALSRASLANDPDATMCAMRDEYNAFDMPGKIGIPDFDMLAAVIGLSGVFDLGTIARSKQEIIAKLGIADVEPLTDEGRAAEAELVDTGSETAVRRQERLMQSLRSRVTSECNPQGLRPFLLGVTIDWDTLDTGAGSRVVGLQAIA